MTATVPLPARRSPAQLIGLVAIVLIGFAIAAYIDWRWWHPSSQLATILGIVGAAGLGVLAAFVRQLPPVVRFGPLALAIGLLAGMNLGPSRPSLISHEAQLVLRLTAPFEAEATSSGSCDTVANGDQLFVADAAAFLVGEGDAAVHIRVALSRGDMWDAPRPRSDGISLRLWSAPNALTGIDDGTGETEMISTPSSSLVADAEGLDGSVTFAGLEAADHGTGGINGPAIPYEGTLEWRCAP